MKTHDQSDMINEVFGDRISVVGEAELKEYHLPVGTSETLKELTSLLYTQVELSYWNGDLNFSEDELFEVAHYLVQHRCAYVFGIKGEIHPKDVELPALFGPVLATIGRYRDDTANMVLTPVPLDLVDEQGDGSYVAKKNAKCKAPDCYKKVMAALRTLGVPTIFGLPMDKETESADFFRVEVADSVLRGNTSQAPTPVALFSRALVNMTYLESVFGSARVTYATVGTMKIGLRDLVQRNIDGIRGR